MSAGNPRRIAVIGAGIGGLTLAIALRRHGIAVDIYEQTAELREVGAAVALSANGTRFFEHFGLAGQLAPHWFEVAALIFRNGRNGHLVGRHAVGTDYRERFGASYVGIHRADLQAVLSAAAGLDCIHLSKRLVDIDDRGKRCALRFADGDAADADLVIGADRRALVRAAVDARLRRCAVFRVQRVSRHRADGRRAEPA
jgi:salicylate hydroxylase